MWSTPTLPTLLLAIAAAVGLPELLRLVIRMWTRAGRAEGAKVETDAWAVASQELRGWTSDARDEAQRARTDARELEGTLRAEMSAMRAAHDQDRDELDARFARLEADRDGLRTAVEELRSWGRVMVTRARRAGIDFPAPPPGVSDTDPRLRVAVSGE